MAASEKKPVVDLSELLRPDEGKWVAISGDKSSVLCDADSIEELLGKCKEYEALKPIILRVPDEHTAQLL
jgi:hypothetical protein